MPLLNTTFPPESLEKQKGFPPFCPLLPAFLVVVFGFFRCVRVMVQRHGLGMFLCAFSASMFGS
jgi:hypothetical protein